MKRAKMKVIVDTREKYPYAFQGYACSVETKKLDTGDYSIAGMEHLVCIERKSSVSELSNNLCKDFARFERELERMQEFEYRILILEFTEKEIARFPYRSGLPKRVAKKIRFRGPAILSKLKKIVKQYDLQLFFTSGPEEAEELVFELLEEIWEQ